MSGQIDLETHVIPVLEALEWVGGAARKLGELDALAAFSPELKKWVGTIPNPDPIEPVLLMAQVAWVAKSLVSEYQAQEGGEA
jgi:hypothetical protein